MIPYFQWISFSLGPIPIQVWGLMVATGMFAALLVIRWAARQRNLNEQVVLDLAFWIILGSLLGARVLYVVSEWQLFAGQLVNVFKVWEGGMSISGGFIGAVIAGWVFLRRKELNFVEYADVVVFGLPVGLWIGRLGCFFIFDHPGEETTFFLGQTYADGVIRHNHGLYLSLNGLVLSIIFAIAWKRNPKRATGWYAAFFLTWYGVVRFLLDFFRAHDGSGAHADARLLGLTAAQYTSLVMLGIGLVVWYTLHHANNTKAGTKSPKNR